MNLKTEQQEIIQSDQQRENRLKSMNRASETWDNDKISKIYIIRARRQIEIKGENSPNLGKDISLQIQGEQTQMG